MMPSTSARLLSGLIMNLGLTRPSGKEKMSVACTASWRGRSKQKWHRPDERAVNHREEDAANPKDKEHADGIPVRGSAGGLDSQWRSQIAHQGHAIDQTKSQYGQPKQRRIGFQTEILHHQQTDHGAGNEPTEQVQLRETEFDTAVRTVKRGVPYDFPFQRSVAGRANWRTRRHIKIDPNGSPTLSNHTRPSVGHEKASLELPGSSMAKETFSGCFDSPSLTRWSGIRSDIAQHDSGRIHSRQTGDITWQNLRNRTTRNDRNLSLRQTQGRDGKKTYCTFAPGSASSFAFTIL